MRRALLGIVVGYISLANAYGLDIDEFIDRIDETLRLSAFNDNFRARLSGTLDLEAYHFTDPAPGLIDTSQHNLFNPRLSLFLDAQIGSQLYFFSQVRIDRGFDPGDNGARLGLDEYALRLTPWENGVLNVQVGKFATIAGNWVERHLSWDNPFINAPLPYEHVTSVSDIELPRSNLPRTTERTKYEFLPLIWGPSYATGLSIAGALSSLQYAVEVKNSSLSSRPEVWDATRRDFSHPTFTSHLAFQPNPAWKLGFSASEGAYLRDEAAPLLAPHHDVGDFHQLLLGEDISFAWRHWQLWAEAYEVRFQVPRFGNADAFCYYIEAKYKFTPQSFAAIRWNQAFFATLSDGSNMPWSPNISRIEGVIGHRFTPHTQLKLQYYLDHEARSKGDVSHTIATQFTVRF